MLPARNRMTRSAEFHHTVKHGVRAAQPAVVVHAVRCPDASSPHVGFIVSKSVGGSVDRHRVSRRLRHVVRALADDLAPDDRVVVRALPGSRDAASSQLRDQVQAGLRRAHRLMDRER